MRKCSLGKLKDSSAKFPSVQVILQRRRWALAPSVILGAVDWIYSFETCDETIDQPALLEDLRPSQTHGLGQESVMIL